MGIKEFMKLCTKCDFSALVNTVLEGNSAMFVWLEIVKQCILRKIRLNESLK